MTFGQRVMMLRQQHGLKRVELANALNIKQTTLRHYELDEREPGTDTIIAVAKYFHVTVDYLIGNEEIEIRPIQWELIRATADLPDEKIAAIINLVIG